MRVVLQRVSEAKVQIGGITKGEIDGGYLLLVGISNTDTTEVADKMIEKISKLRIFEDENGKTNLSISQVSGNLLVVSQFTLYADCKKGNRPSFMNAGSPDHAEELYNYIVEKFKEMFPDVQSGEFGADMKVSLVNDGPFTIILDSSEIM